MPTQPLTTRDARLDFRLSQEHKGMIEQAAAVTGQSLSDFAVANLVQAAQRTVDEATVTRLSMRDRDVFLKLIESVAKPNKALKSAADQYRKRRA
jgi:uncharacterized protein (DUF1778 family)